MKMHGLLIQRDEKCPEPSKRDNVRVDPRPDTETVIAQLPIWLAYYNEVHPDRAVGYQYSRRFIAKTCEAPSGL